MGRYALVSGVFSESSAITSFGSATRLSQFERCRLCGSSLRQADLRDVTLDAADLTDAKLIPRTHARLL
jgi:uncharacterized protein YjbI with pentapeptide repeats